MHGAFQRISTPKVDQMLHHHCLVARSSPENRGGKARGLGEGFEQVSGQDLRRLHRRDRFDVVIGGTEQDAPQPQKVTRYLEIDDLACPSRQELVRADPTVGQDVGGGVDLPLMDQILARE